MLGCFPDPYPDELLYSVCARFQDRVQYLRNKAVVQELFGTISASAVVFLPCRLASLVNNLPPGHPCTVERLIDYHTLLPFYAPFLPPERVTQIKQDMAEDKSYSVHRRTGIFNRRVRPPQWFRFCPLCVQENCKNLGETYWYRLHQLPGVEVCPIHAVFLENSQVQTYGRRKRYELLSANQTIKIVLPRLLNLDIPLHQQLLQIARNADWLLKNSNFVQEPIAIHERYLALLSQQDLATFTGQIRLKPLLAVFKEYYSPEFLELLQCAIGERDSHNWLARLVRSPKHSCYPLYHLLMIQFLGHTVESFFSVSNELKPFGDAPWYCLNPICNYFRQSHIQKCDIKQDAIHGGRITGTFCCDCGFTYSRLGSDKSPEDRFKVGKVKAWGHLWEATLKELWEDSSVTLMAMAKRLGADSQTVKYQATRLGLTFPRQGPTARCIQNTIKKDQKESVPDPSPLEKYRIEWLVILQENPNSTRTELSQHYQRVYSWLNFYDREWLKSHLPFVKRRNEFFDTANWQERDVQVADAIRDAAMRVTNKLGKPERLTKTAIASEAGYLPLIQRQLKKLPLTSETLSQLVETTEEFAIRRIEWAVSYFYTQGISPKRWELIRLTGCSQKTLSLPKVALAIDQALQTLESGLIENDRNSLALRLAV